MSHDDPSLMTLVLLKSTLRRSSHSSECIVYYGENLHKQNHADEQQLIYVHLKLKVLLFPDFVKILDTCLSRLYSNPSLRQLVPFFWTRFCSFTFSHFYNVDRLKFGQCTTMGTCRPRSCCFLVLAKNCFTTLWEVRVDFIIQGWVGLGVRCLTPQNF